MKKYLTKEDLKSLSQAIAKAESSTSGEIRVVLRHKRRWRERKLSLHELALKEFQVLKMQHTRGRTGILILLLFAERKFHIIADEGINKEVKEGTWDKIAAAMSEHFKRGNFAGGIAEAVHAVGAELTKHFPRKPDDTNELPDEVIEE